MITLKEGYVLRNIIDEYLVMPIGAEMNSFSNLLVLNECGAFLWNNLKTGVESEEALVALMTAEYDVSAEEAAADAHAFLDELRGLNLLVE